MLEKQSKNVPFWHSAEGAWGGAEGALRGAEGALGGAEGALGGAEGATKAQVRGGLPRSEATGKPPRMF